MRAVGFTAHMFARRRIATEEDVMLLPYILMAVIVVASIALCRYFEKISKFNSK